MFFKTRDDTILLIKNQKNSFMVLALLYFKDINNVNTGVLFTYNNAVLKAHNRKEIQAWVI